MTLSLFLITSHADYKVNNSIEIGSLYIITAIALGGDNIFFSSNGCNIAHTHAHTHTHTAAIKVQKSFYYVRK